MSKRYISFNGKEQCLSAWARELGIHQVTLRERTERWDIEKALTTRKLNRVEKQNNRLITFNGKTQCLQAWAVELGIEWSNLASRLERWSVEDALTLPVGKRPGWEENTMNQAELSADINDWIIESAGGKS